jgi:ribonuclease E
MANNKMLIDAAHPEETRVAMVRGNKVDEFDFESDHKTQLRGNIYLAKVTRVEPSLQAAFVDYGGNRHGFLAFSEIHPDYYQIPVADRQALLDAEAEDARMAEEAEAKAHGDDDVDGEAEDSIEADAKEKPARKRRSRRRGKKSADADASEDASEEATDESVEAKSSDDVSETDDAPAPEVTTDEESDSDDTTMSADNDGDDVVSEPAAAEEEPAKKPRKRTTRKKKEPVAEEATEESVSEASPEAEEKPKPKRRTSRKKKVEEPAAEAETDTKPDEAAADSVSEDATGEEEPKKRKRRTSRKKKVESSDEAEATNEETVAADDTPAEASEASEETDGEEKPKKRSRSRSRRSRSKKNNNSDESADSDNDTAEIEAVGAEDALEEVAVPVRRANRRHYKIQEVIKRRQILLVQVVKEERGNKGAALTTYLSLAGRYSVLMPNTARGGGISRKITNSADRKRLKATASKLEVPQGMGVILRTAGASRSQEEIQRDFEYLMRLWENVRTLTLESTAPCLTYEEGSLIKRSIRDLFDKDTSEILVAGEDGYKEAKDFMTMLMPEQAKNVKRYRDKVPMFTRMGVEAQLDAMLQPQVTLKSGGYLIIDQTEALVAIDVNSGRSTRQHSVEDTATQTNLEAADEVARQLRLRDLAGLIVIDFIDMEDKRNVRNVEKRLKDALKNDRARIQVGRISHFGLMEMSRQRIRASVLESTTQTCPTCDGLGHVRSSSSVALTVVRAIEDHLNKNSRNHLTVKVSTETALYLLNTKRESISDLETRFGVSITIETDHTLGLNPCVIERGEQSNRRPAGEAAVQPDTIAPSESVEEQAVATSPNTSTHEEGEDGEGKKRKRRRRRRRGGSSNNDETANAEGADNSAEASADAAAAPETAETSDTNDAAPQDAVAETAEETKPKRTSRRKKKVESVETSEPVSEETSSSDTDETEKPRRTSRPRKPKKEPVASDDVKEDVQTAEVEAKADDAASVEDVAKPPRRTTRRKSASTEASVAEAPAETVSETADTPTDDEPKSKKGGWWQRKFF